MKKRNFILALTILTIALIQSTILDYIKIHDIKPNLLIVFIVLVALLKGNIHGAVIGFFTGLTQHFITGKVIGIYSLLGLFLGYTIGSLNKRIYRENFIVIIFFTAVSTFLYELLIYAFNTLFKGYNSLAYCIWNIILPETIYNSVASIFVFIFIYKLFEKFDSAERAIRKY